MSQSPTPIVLSELADSLLQPAALAEFGLVAVCLGLSWMVVRLLRGTQVKAASVLFGRRVFDGVLFPVLALLFAIVARALLSALGMPIAVFRLAIPVLISLVVIRLTVRVLSAAFPDSRPVRVIERTVSWLAWIGAVLWITGVLPIVMNELDAVNWTLGATRISARNLLEGTLSAVTVLVLALWLSAAIEAQLIKGAATADLSMRKIASSAVRALLLFVGLMLALSAAGIDLTALSVLGGAIGVGLGFGLQKIAANYVSGFVILAERSLRIGDVVKVDNFEGRIIDIRTRYTVIRSLGGREAIVPNEMLITQRIENLSLADTRVMLSSTVQVAYGTDVAALQPKLVAAIRAVPRVIGDPGPGAQLSAFGSDGMDITLLFWISDPENGQGNVKSDVNLAVLALFAAEGVEIPFPQRVVHLAPVGPEQSAQGT
ncbi:mechanosensitive ion channel family protein [Piscinibacter sp.]|uniref:mechanosensitive ion channel family protein n=1 Tax=Piscinibacter sp. TaxID=1903157 RepID=UPI002B72CFB0|nr:mechanosensitive ion channel domain-containing protein [Albitalea sp.]HUG23913.1 mechanosensitive ion channel domain-containing protein [Albitalea sp.]